MTTITYRDGVLCADSMASAGYIRLPGRVTKIVRRADGAIGGACGNATFCEAWKDWLLGKLKKMPEPGPPEDDEGGDAGVLVSATGELRIYESGGYHVVDQPYFAIGCGASVAMGAMFVGATAEEAVRAAIALDVYTGGEPTVLELTRERA